MVGGPAAPPGFDAAMSTPGPAVVRDGTYGGTADVLMTHGGLCLENKRVKDFHVQGNKVRYGGFRGTIAPDGMLQMAYGQDWIVGQFAGATFQGHLDVPGRIGDPGCSYMLKLQLIGP